LLSQTRLRGSAEESFILTSRWNDISRNTMEGWTVLECGVSTKMYVEDVHV
jgi:hypothetical protein